MAVDADFFLQVSFEEIEKIVIYCYKLRGMQIVSISA